MTCSPSCGFIAHLVIALHRYCRGYCANESVIDGPTKMTCSPNSIVFCNNLKTLVGKLGKFAFIQ